MEAFVTLVFAVISVIGLNFAALQWGADSRPGMTDDHQR